jgi:predicted metallo-beta-lactamase superfamily hydrolase
VRHLLEHDTVPVEAMCDVGVPLHRLRHLEPHRAELAHLAQKAHKAVRIVDHERVVVLGHLEQLASELHR